MWREKAREQNLIIPANAPGKKFVFDLNDGQVTTRPDANHVFRLVEIAREFGEHQALLTKVAERKELESAFVWWARPYHVPYEKKNWITLEEWLKEKGYNIP